MFDNENIRTLISRAINKNSLIYEKYVSDEDKLFVFFQKDILNNAEVYDIVVGENPLYNGIEIRMRNNYQIPINNVVVIGNFMTIKSRYRHKNEHSTLAYYVCENNKKYSLYKQMNLQEKKLIKDFSALNEDVFDYILKELESIYKSMKLIK